MNTLCLDFIERVHIHVKEMAIYSSRISYYLIMVTEKSERIVYIVTLMIILCIIS
jgi:hypothetical protein